MQYAHNGKVSSLDITVQIFNDIAYGIAIIYN